MLQFLLAIPDIVLYGCVCLVVIFIVMVAWLFLRVWRVGSQIRVLTNSIANGNKLDQSRRREGLPHE